MLFLSPQSDDTSTHISSSSPVTKTPWAKQARHNQVDDDDVDHDHDDDDEMSGTRLTQYSFFSVYTGRKIRMCLDLNVLLIFGTWANIRMDAEMQRSRKQPGMLPPPLKEFLVPRGNIHTGVMLGSAHTMQLLFAMVIETAGHAADLHEARESRTSELQSMISEIYGRNNLPSGTGFIKNNASSFSDHSATSSDMKTDEDESLSCEGGHGSLEQIMNSLVWSGSLAQHISGVVISPHAAIPSTEANI
jgi:hypothetical protein